LILATILSYSLYLVLAQWYLKDEPSLAIMFYVVATITVVTGISWLSSDRPSLALEPQGWLLLALIVIGSTYLAQITLLKSVRHLGSGQFALLGPLEILLTLFWSASFLGDTMSPVQWLGGTFILFSLILVVFWPKPSKPKAPRRPS
jgi:drug/metabolite transporter (DMT)-like permease